MELFGIGTDTLVSLHESEKENENCRRNQGQSQIGEGLVDGLGEFRQGDPFIFDR
ncbi:hypothetical protein LBU01_05530 [Lentilactobacillus buchneri]|nr:hypothetical protein LBU01_05530 [Lentilactobacillus buchneri]